MSSTAASQRQTDKTSTPLDPSLYANFARLGVATVYEASGRQGLIDVALQPLLTGARIAGPARVALCGQGDNRAVHAAIARTQPGEVVVLTMPEPAPVALIGELLAIQAQQRGAAGILVDAAVRDVEEIQSLGLPVWTRWIRARGATKNTPGQLDVPVTVGGARIGPGDLVVLDTDGAVVVAQGDLDRVLTASQARLDRETAFRTRLEAGALSYDLHGMREQDQRLASVAGEV